MKYIKDERDSGSPPGPWWPDILILTRTRNKSSGAREWKFAYHPPV